METTSSGNSKLIHLLPGILILCGLYLTRLYSYLLFHSLAELFSIVVACCIFMVTWNSRKFLDNNYLLFIGIAYLFIGILDMVHTLSYKGMGVFEGYGANLPTQLWIAARYMESATLLIAPLLMARRFKSNPVFYGYLFLTALLLTTIFYGNIFPDCFVEGSGLTPFKKISEYIISLILTGAMIFLFQKKSEFDQNIFALLYISIVLTIGAELAFTFYVSVYGLSNLVGHYLKIISFYLIYKAIIETGLRKPYAVMFKNLKSGETSLKKSESKFRLLYESAPLGYQSLDEKGRLMDVNQAWLDALGYTNDDVVGKSFGDFLHPDLTDQFEADFHRFKAGGEVFDQEFEMVKKDDSTILVSFSGKIAKDEKGNFQQTHCIFHDITEQKRKENLKAAQLRLIDYSTDHSVNELLQKFLDEAEKLTGSEVGFFHFVEDDQKTLSLQTWSTNTMKNMCTTEGTDRHYPISKAGVWVDCVRKRKPVIHNDYANLPHKKGLPEGHTPIIRELVVPVIRQKKIVGILGVGNKGTDYHQQDVNTVKQLADLAWETVVRRRAEVALHTSHERFLTVLDGIDATIYVADMKTHKILFMNKHMIESFGKDMTGESCWKAFRGESEPCPHCTNKQLIDENQKPTGVCIWQGKNPITGKWYMNHDRAIEWTDGRLVRLQIATDITDFKKMEEELRQARKMESIGTLTGGIAHDFNNLLYMIVGNTEMALEDIPEWNPAHANLKEVKAASLKAAGIVKQLLNFSRKTDQDLKPIAAVSVITDALKFLRSTIPSTIEIRKHLPDREVTILADPIQINQVMMNLCINASHAMEGTGGILEITVENITLDEKSVDAYPDLTQGDYIKITVNDTGSGIETDIINRIFDPYFTTKAVGKGSGMGLAVVHGIVQNHDGAIYVASKPGKGTTFTLLFPVAAKKSVIKVKTFDELPSGNEAILFVDDNASIANMATKALTRLGYSLQTKTNPVEALALFQSNPHAFDLVITDMTMPGMTGAQLAEKLKDIRTDVPVVICTGHSSLINEKKAKKMGIAAFVMKPITQTEIAKTIRKVLDGKN